MINNITLDSSYGFDGIMNNKDVNKLLKTSVFNRFIGYFENDELIGYIDYSLIYDRIEINNIEVIDNYRNKGIGTKLLNYLISNNDVDNISLEVRVDNYPAIKLYKNSMFKAVAERKGYYKGVDGLLMVRSTYE